MILCYHRNLWTLLFDWKLILVDLLLLNYPVARVRMILMSTLTFIGVIVIPIDLLRVGVIVKGLGLRKYCGILELNCMDQIALEMLALTVKVGCEQTHIFEL